MYTDKWKRIGFIKYPTLFQEMKNLQKAIEAKTRIFFKRDDLTEVGLGGNKNRKLEYVMREAMDSGADTVITWAGLQSNHCRQTLAYARMLGLECHIVLNGRSEEQPCHQGNLLIFDIFGAHIHFQPDEALCDETCQTLVEELKARGKKPYYVPIGASNELGSLGYIDCVHEIARQASELGVKLGHIFVASGSAGTQAGTHVGARLYLPGCKVHGVSVSRAAREQADKVTRLSRSLVRFIGADVEISDDEVVVHDEYLGDGYAIPTRAGIDAIRLVGQTQAILLDPVYTGKAMSGMLDLLQKGELDDSDAIAFIHTGGGPAVFHFANYFSALGREADIRT